MIKSLLLPSGNFWDFQNPAGSNFTVADIAHNLSNICRFNGACEEFYSVAQHSVLVSYLVPLEQQLDALFHDKAEFVYGDMTTWLKSLCPDYVALLNEADDIMADKLGIARGMTPEIKHADYQMLALEKMVLYPRSDSLDGFHHIVDIEPPFGEIVLLPMPPREARALFMNRYFELAA